jgi:hypothetical protein
MNANYAVVADRANHRCEYCHAPELVFNFPFEVEHIIPLCKQGIDTGANLALACRSCNLRKGIYVRGVDPNSGVEVPLFHPRQDQWSEHFQVELEVGLVSGVTPVGRATVSSLQMNSSSQVAARKLWIRLNIFP